MPLPAPAPAPVPAPDQAPAPRRLPRAVGVALATAGLLAVTAASAAVTVAVGKPDSRPAAAPAPRATATASPSAGASATPSAVPVPTVVPSEPAPASTVKGTVSNGKHEGDLRYFLLPIPAGGESYGPADGMPMTRDDVSGIFGKQDDIDTILNRLGYRDGATRTYRTADGKAEVTVTLLHFGSADTASRFVQGYTIKSQEPIDIDGDPNAHGFRRTPKHEAYTGSMTGVSSQGDVQYTIDVDVKGTPDKALLNDLMKRQREWLASGG
ncbi:putative protein OS=Kitasatospora aureofaciens OX=1894 GN=GCM10010502_19910 PE=4 SV=1 [Kitasatospora aureofaciens]|uniref:Uncharacterized protein n=1 Tax=Kitasatospora aureofaciens TaxID=1894 RepID=A0A8H9HMT5_KITAU|nr:hypothetical protein CP971_00335 [Streptomyces viridifaciens]GGU68855.1 hypothetical protein GCM10010502_19910 [Kitasatospora aureofaciens]